MSSRRVPKGPGRRPMTEKRHRFLEMTAQGSTLRDACRELEIHRSTGQLRKNGTTVRRKDGTVRFVPPLEPFTVRVISPRFLSEDDRVQIADLASRGHGPTAIGQLLGRAPSTISRELRRNLHPSGYYRPFHAHATAAARRHRTHPLKLIADPVLKAYVLGTRQIRAERQFAQPMLSVHRRYFEPTDRSEAGHREGGLIVGAHNRSAIGALIERQTRCVKLLHLPAYNSLELHAALVRAFGQLPAPLRRSLTWNQGTEMARHLDISADTGARIYFCDAASPWQRGSNENANGLLRQ